jgi:hypothetical protein
LTRPPRRAHIAIPSRARGQSPRTREGSREIGALRLSQRRFSDISRAAASAATQPHTRARSPFSAKAPALLFPSTRPPPVGKIPPPPNRGGGGKGACIAFVARGDDSMQVRRAVDPTLCPPASTLL